MGQLPVGVKRVWLHDSEVLGLVVAGLRRRDSLGHRSIRGQERKKMVVEDKRCVRLFGNVFNRLLASVLLASRRSIDSRKCPSVAIFFRALSRLKWWSKKKEDALSSGFLCGKIGLGPLSRTRRVLYVSSVYLVVLQ